MSGCSRWTVAFDNASTLRGIDKCNNHWRNGSMSNSKTYLFVTNDAWFFASHRLPIAERLISDGHKVVVAAKPDEKVSQIEDAGCVFEEWSIEPRGTRRIKELYSLSSLASIIIRNKPDVIHLVTIKAVIYGGLLARILYVRKVVCAISGLGAILEGDHRVSDRLLKVYRFSVNHPRCTLIFQNPENRKKLSELLGISEGRSTIIRGSGVNLNVFRSKPEPDGVVVVTMASRILKDKGVTEYLDAAKILAVRGVKVVMQLAGDDTGAGNPASYSQEDLRKIKNSRHIQYLGYVSDTATLFSESSIVVLPSYHEGLPKVLQEAAACGRAVVTTDAPGCMFAVIANVTALIVPVKNAIALADAIQMLIEDKNMRTSFAMAGRKLAEDHFSIDSVVDAHMKVYDSH